MRYSQLVFREEKVRNISGRGHRKVSGGWSMLGRCVWIDQPGDFSTVATPLPEGGWISQGERDVRDVDTDRRKHLLDYLIPREAPREKPHLAK